MAESKFVWRDLVLKSVKEVKREGKQSLLFVDVVDPGTYASTGDYMYMPKDREEKLPLEGTRVDVYIANGTYQGRPSINFASIKPSGVTSASKVG